MKSTCVLFAIGCVSLIGFSARAAQAQTAAAAPTAPSATTATLPAVTPTAVTPTAATPTASPQDGKTVAQRDRVETTEQKATFTRRPMTSRIFPSMWQ
jgi:hypothetical protein